MKTHYVVRLLLVVAICAILFGCTKPSEKISSSTVKDLVLESLNEQQKTDVYSFLKVGYYEENDDAERYILRKLAAAGVINYAIEKVSKPLRVKDGYSIDYSTYRVVDKYKTVSKTVYFVTVSLTEQGQSFVVDKIPVYPAKIDKFMVPAEIGHYPEFDAPLKDVFPDDQITSTTEPEKKDADKSSAKQEPKNEYEKAKARESIEHKIVRCYTAQIVDVRNILVNEGASQAEFVLEATNVSPFGRIFNGVYENTHSLGSARFIYYQDKGWSVINVNAEEEYI